MTTVKKEKTCADKVQDKYDELVQEFIEAQRYYDIYDHDKNGYIVEAEEISKYSPENTDLSNYDDFFSYMNERGLSFDYVEPDTFNDQSEGYWRFQLSWGGPSDEFRIYTTCEHSKEIDYIEYWYMDWFDGAKVDADDDIIQDICNMFLEVV